MRFICVLCMCAYVWLLGPVYMSRSVRVCTSVLISYRAMLHFFLLSFSWALIRSCVSSDWLSLVLLRTPVYRRRLAHCSLRGGEVESRVCPPQPPHLTHKHTHTHTHTHSHTHDWSLECNCQKDIRFKGFKPSTRCGIISLALPRSPTHFRSSFMALKGCIIFKQSYAMVSFWSQ